jgi:hypothetical protein
MRVENGEPGEPSEVSSIESEQPADSMSPHRSDKPGVEGYAAITGMGSDQRFPLGKQSWQVRKEAKQSFHPRNLNLALGDGQPKPIQGYWSSGCSPELIDVLGDHAEDLTAGVQRAYGYVHRGERRVRGPSVAKEYIRVEEDQSWLSSRSR